MRIESDGHSQGNPRLYELVEHAPKTGKSPTVWAWPELMDYLKIAGQHLGLAAALVQQADRLGEGARCLVAKPRRIHTILQYPARHRPASRAAGTGQASGLGRA